MTVQLVTLSKTHEYRLDDLGLIDKRKKRSHQFYSFCLISDDEFTINRLTKYDFFSGIKMPRYKCLSEKDFESAKTIIANAYLQYQNFVGDDVINLVDLKDYREQAIRNGAFTQKISLGSDKTIRSVGIWENYVKRKTVNSSIQPIDPAVAYPLFELFLSAQRLDG